LAECPKFITDKDRYTTKIIQAIQEYTQIQMKSIVIQPSSKTFQYNNNLLTPIKTIFNLGWGVCEKKMKQKVVMGLLKFISLYKRL